MVFFGGLFTLLAIILSAYFEHAVKGTVTDKQFSSLKIALDFHFLHSVSIFLVGLFTVASDKMIHITLLPYAVYAWMVGVLLFSISIYLNVIFQWSFVSKLIPVGGFSLMLGWLIITAIGAQILWNS